MKFRELNYPTVGSLLLGVCAVVLIFCELERILPELQVSYVLLKIFYAFFGFGMAFYFNRYEYGDLALSVFFIGAVSYCLVFMWFAPLYEAAYLQCALAGAFFRLRRQWIYPVCFGVGLLGIFLTYSLQDAMNWIMPPTERIDWIYVVTAFFLVCWMIQQFAVSAHMREKDKLSRLSTIGAESNRLFHDIKGLMSSPLLIVDGLKEQGAKISFADYHDQVVFVAAELKKVRDSLRSINRLVVTDDRLVMLDPCAIAAESAKILERRMQNISVRYPEPNLVMANAGRLNSVFFNLFLNALQAFEGGSSPPAVRHAGAKIDLFWRGDTLVFEDNAGGMNAQRVKPESSGIGLDLIKSDLTAMGAGLKIVPTLEGTAFEIMFRSRVARRVRPAPNSV